MSETGSSDGPYQIRVTGVLDQRWAAAFDGLLVTPMPDGTTVIHGRRADQSALPGVLARLSDLGLSLVSVQRTDHPTPDPTRSAT